MIAAVGSSWPIEDEGLPERLAPETEAGEAVGGEDREDQREARRADRDDDAVEEVARDVRLSKSTLL